MATARTVDGVDIHFDTFGEGPDVVLVHGITDSSGTWGQITPTLAERYRVTTVDLRGHGRSGEAPSYDSVRMTHDLQAVAEAAALVDPLLVGHSLGGIVVSAYGANAPTRGIVNVDQPLQLSAFQAALAPAEALLRDPESFGPVLAAVFESMDGEGMTDEVAERIRAHRAPSQEVVLGVWETIFSSTVEQLDQMVETLVGPITAPYLALQYMPVPPGYDEWLLSRIPHAVIEHAVAGSGHYEHLLDPQRFVDRIVAFDS